MTLVRICDLSNVICFASMPLDYWEQHLSLSTYLSNIILKVAESPKVFSILCRLKKVCIRDHQIQTVEVQLFHTNFWRMKKFVPSEFKPPLKVQLSYWYWFEPKTTKMITISITNLVKFRCLEYILEKVKLQKANYEKAVKFKSSEIYGDVH